MFEVDGAASASGALVRGCTVREIRKVDSPSTSDDTTSRDQRRRRSCDPNGRRRRRVMRMQVRTPCGSSSSAAAGSSAPPAPRLAVERGIDLYVLNRGSSTDRPLPAQATVLHGDIRDPESVDRGARRSGLRRRRRLGRVHAGPRAGRHRAVPGPHRAVRVHQLGVGLPDAARPGAGRGVHAAAQPVLAVLPRQDRLRGPARRGVPRRGLPGDDRAPVAHVRQDRSCRSTAAGRCWTGCGRARRSSCTATARRCGR